MNFLRTFRIGTRLAAAFSILLMLLLTVASLAFLQMERQSKVTRIIVDEQSLRVSLVEELQRHAQGAALPLLQLLVTQDRDKRIPLYTEMDNANNAADEALTKLIKASPSAEDKRLLEQLSTLRNNYHDLFRETVEKIEIDGPQGAQEHFANQTQPALINLLNASSKLVARQHQAMQAGRDALEITVAHARSLVIIISVSAILLGALLAWAVTISITKPLTEAVAFARAIANGNLKPQLLSSNHDEVGDVARSVTAIQQSVLNMSKDTDYLLGAAVEGNLSKRVDASSHHGDFRKIIEGMNTTLDSVISPLNVAANYVDRISKGDIPAKITTSFNGDFNIIKNNLNTCIEAISNMVKEANKLEQAAVDGQLAIRADASKYQGDFQKVLLGVNNCLDAVVKPLNVAAGYVENFAKGTIPAKITDNFSGDFNTIKNNLNACIDALNLLVADTNMLSQAAQSNRLETRAEANKHLGDYKKMVEGINGTLDTVMQKNAVDAAEKAKQAHVLEEAVEETQSIIEAAKDGDLSSRVSLDGKTGAIASLCDGVNALMDQMTEVIVQVRESGETINTAAGEIASGNNDLSSRTEQQASSLEETAASMEQLASTVKNNAENAKQANQLAIAASGIAVKGGKVVSEVVGTMSAINQSAKKIEDIISVIDGIAFQTNILALNAAVEAARAGEQGRGFAVVAGEVRNLAQRSASAAKEIKELITDSVSKTAEGTKQVETAGSTMQEIVSSVQRVTDIMGEITAASVEQSAGIDQVNTAVTSMDEVTQQNAALVEQAAAAAESLVEQAMGLIEKVSAFKLSSSNANKPKHNPKALLSLVKVL
ncbi:MAG: chemotaxis protein [Methylotenera sp.]|nr:MAG: chemotaxis protein [Methylotenera sp.]